MSVQATTLSLILRGAIITKHCAYHETFETIANDLDITPDAARTIYRDAVRRASGPSFLDILMGVSNPDRKHVATSDTGMNESRSIQPFPFLKLPFEIRSQIYKDDLGSNLIHVVSHNTHGSSGPGTERTTWHKGKGLIHSLCEAETSEDLVYKDFMADCMSMGRHDRRHSNCTVNLEFPPYRASLRLDLSMLLVCKQIYNEARLVHYAHNTFSFSDTITFTKFGTELLPDQLSAIRAMHFEAVITDHQSANRWNKALTRPKFPFSRLEPGMGLQLRVLHVSLRLAQHLFPPHSPVALMSYPDFWRTGFLRLQQCPFTRVTATITELYHGRNERNWRPSSLGKCQITATDKHKFCEDLIQMLLGPYDSALQEALDAPDPVALASLEADTFIDELLDSD